MQRRQPDTDSVKTLASAALSRTCYSIAVSHTVTRSHRATPTTSRWVVGAPEPYSDIISRNLKHVTVLVSGCVFLCGSFTLQGGNVTASTGCCAMSSLSLGVGYAQQDSCHRAHNSKFVFGNLAGGIYGQRGLGKPNDREAGVTVTLLPFPVGVGSGVLHSSVIFGCP
jgi:hypothetical protein